jgi:hypothetical protein
VKRIDALFDIEREINGRAADRRMGVGNRRRQAGQRDRAHAASELVMAIPDAILRRRGADREQNRRAPRNARAYCTRLQKLVEA